MFFDTYRLATLRVAEDLRQAEAERSLRSDAPAAEISPASATTSPASAVVAATADCGTCRPSVAA